MSMIGWPVGLGYQNVPSSSSTAMPSVSTEYVVGSGSSEARAADTASAPITASSRAPHAPRSASGGAALAPGAGIGAGGGAGRARGAGHGAAPAAGASNRAASRGSAD